MDRRSLFKMLAAVFVSPVSVLKGVTKPPKAPPRMFDITSHISPLVPYKDTVEQLSSVSMELDPVNAPGVFTEIAELKPFTFTVSYVFKDEEGGE